MFDNPIVIIAAPFIAFAVIMGAAIGVHQWWIGIGRIRHRSLDQLCRPMVPVRMSEARALLTIVDRLEHSPDDRHQRWATNHLHAIRTWLKANRRFGKNGNQTTPPRRVMLLDDVETRLANRGSRTVGVQGGHFDAL